MNKKENIESENKVKSDEELKQETVKHYQDYMVIIRRSIGWSAEDLANTVEFERQTINNIESKPPRIKFSYDRYIGYKNGID